MDEELPLREREERTQQKPIPDGEKGQLWLRCPGWEVWFGGVKCAFAEGLGPGLPARVPDVGAQRERLLLPHAPNHEFDAR